jgi:predicted permease
MSILAQIRSWLHAVTHRSRLEREMEAELVQHLAARTDDLIRHGMAPAEAERRARIELGAALTAKEGMRASLGLRLADELLADIRYSFRLLAKTPGFTAIAAISLALAIGANTTIFSVAKQLLYERLAVPHPTELRLLSWTSVEEHMAVHHLWGDWDDSVQGYVSSHSFTYPVYEQLRDLNKKRIALLAFKETGMNATIREQAQQVQTEMLSGNAYQILGVQAQLGRTIQSSDDEAPGKNPVAVISDGLWSRAFARSPDAIGQTIKLNDATLTIVGVNPPGFTGAGNVLKSPDVFIPMSMQPLVSPHGQTPSLLNDSKEWWVNIIGRQLPGQTDEGLKAALTIQFKSVLRSTLPLRPNEVLPRLILVDGSRGLFRQERQFARPMTVLMAMVVFVLLLACANIANLMLARSSNRQRELSVRLALGAGRVRILRQMLVESLLLAALGGAGGLLIGDWGRLVIPKLTENPWERNTFHVNFDWRVFAFTAAITLFTGILFGMAPAIASARAELVHGLKETARTATRRRGGTSGRTLVGVQIALSTLLVIGAGLFARTLFDLRSIDVGFRTDHLLLAEVNPPEGRYSGVKDLQMHERMEREIAAIPGVESASAANTAYVSDDTSRIGFLVEGEKRDPNKDQGEYFNIVGRDFFPTLGIPILEGRGFRPEDTPNSLKVAVINKTLARERFAGKDPIGKRFRVDVHDVDGHGTVKGDDWITVVGVCGDTRYSDLRLAPPAQFILPYFQQPDAREMTYEIRTRVDPHTIIPTLRSKMSTTDRDLPLINVRTQEEQIVSDVTLERVFVTLTSCFGLLALALAAVGIYGVMSYSVSQRTNEIGIRLALGAAPAQVRAMVLRESTWMTIGGIAVGVGGALALTRLVKSMLFGIAPNDPLTMAVGVAVLLLVALGSSWIPARRAASVQPMDALRHE